MANNARGAISFGRFTYDAVGTYAYTITEIAGHEPGMTYDACAYTATVTVTDNGEGNLVANVSYTCGDEAVDGIMFHNVYEKPAKPVTPGEPSKPTKPGRPRKHSGSLVVVKRAIRRVLPATGDQTESILVFAAAIAAAGIGMLIWGGRQR